MLLNFLISSFLIFNTLSDSLPKNSQDSITVGKIHLQNNKKTRDRIILRELTFFEGESYSRADFKEKVIRSENNLRNTSLFNFVTIKDSLSDIYIDVTERWYLWPIPILETADPNFNVWWKTKDISRLNYGVLLAYDNFTGNKDALFFRLQLGYTQKYELSYKFPNLNRKQNIGLNYKIYYSQNHEVPIGTRNDKQIFYGQPNEYVRTQFYTRLGFDYRKQIYNTHSINLSYSNYRANDSIGFINPSYFSNSKNHLNYMSLSYKYVHDKRDFKAYPLNGRYLDFEAVKHGFGESDVNVIELSSILKEHYTLFPKLFGATSFKAKVSNSYNQAYFFNQALSYANSEIGYNNLVRSYEYNVIDGQHYLLAKTDLKYPIIKGQVKQIKSMDERFGKIPYALYMTIFTDAGYVSNRNNKPENKLPNSFLWGYGVGLNYISYYDFVYRLEYSFSKDGARGLFVHFVIPI